MKITFTKLTGDRHKLSVTRSDGSEESAELESKSYLLHDFIHLAYESQAQLMESFWGQLDAGRSMMEMRQDMDPRVADPKTSEIVQTEMIVGPLTGVVQGRASTEQVLNGLQAIFSAYETKAPPFFNQAFVSRVVERVKKFEGEWNSLKIGESMSVTFPVDTSS